MSPGQAKNPYTTGLEIWQPGATCDWVTPGVKDHTSPGERQPPPSAAERERYTAELISKFKVPILRRTLQAILVWDHGFTQEQATESHIGVHLGDHDPKVYRNEMRFTDQPLNNVVFTAGREPTAAESSWLYDLIGLQRDILSNLRLGKSGERYMRAWIRQTGQFDDVTAEANLGFVFAENGKHSIDIAATEKATKKRYAISVKNYNSHMRPDHASINELVAKASLHDAHPWFVVPFAFAETIARCDKAGIRLTILGSQIAPQSYEQDGREKRMNAAIKKLRPVVGPQPYELIGQRADKADFSRVRDYLPSVPWIPNAKMNGAKSTT